MFRFGNLIYRAYKVDEQTWLTNLMIIPLVRQTAGDWTECKISLICFKFWNSALFLETDCLNFKKTI